MPIKLVYFDVGGVLIKDFSKNNKWFDMLEDLGVKESDYDKVSDRFAKEEHKYCTRIKDSDEFANILRSQFGLALDVRYSMLNDFIDRFERNRIDTANS